MRKNKERKKEGKKTQRKKQEKKKGEKKGFLRNAGFDRKFMQELLWVPK